MSGMKTAAGLLALFVTLPIWLYLVYRILVAINAGELMWFLYWAYVPATIVANAMAAMVKAAEKP